MMTIKKTRRIIKFIKIIIEQDFFKELLQEAMTQKKYATITKLIATDMYVRFGNKFLFKEEYIEVRLKPHEAVVMFWILNERPCDLQLIAYEIAEKLTKGEIITQQELMNP